MTARPSTMKGNHQLWPFSFFWPTESPQKPRGLRTPLMSSPEKSSASPNKLQPTAASCPRSLRLRLRRLAPWVAATALLLTVLQLLRVCCPLLLQHWQAAEALRQMGSYEVAAIVEQMASPSGVGISSSSRRYGIPFVRRDRNGVYRFSSGAEVPLPDGYEMLLPWIGRRGRRQLRVAVVNMPDEELSRWQALFPRITFSRLPYQTLPAETPSPLLQRLLRLLTGQGATSSRVAKEWSDLYPEWINETHPEACPSLQLPAWSMRAAFKFDALIAAAPCNASDPNAARSVERHRLLLALAGAAAQSQFEKVSLLLQSECRPHPNLFHCRHLVATTDASSNDSSSGDSSSSRDSSSRDSSSGDSSRRAWFFQLPVAEMRQRLQMMPGSCNMAPTPRLLSAESIPRRVAYVTVLHSFDTYTCGAMVLAQSIRNSGTDADLVLLHSDEISEENRRGLQAAGWQLRRIERIRNPFAEEKAYNEYNYSKMRIWQLTDYDRLIFIDSDLLVLRNLDFLFSYPEISARGNDGSDFNSGVMVIEPAQCTFDMLMDNTHRLVSRNGGDQGFLNEVFTWWHRLPQSVNYLKHIWNTEGEALREELELKDRLFSEEPSQIHTIHYLGRKPWQCYKDYDCNRVYPRSHAYAHEAAHAKWWKVHDQLPQELHKLCWLSSLDKAGIEFNRRKSHTMFPESPEFWNVTTRDPREELCKAKENCDWRSHLKHWKHWF